MGRDVAIGLDAGERVAHGGFHRVMGDQDERRRGARRVFRLLAALEDTLDRDLLVSEDAGNRRHGSRLVMQFQCHVVAAFMGPGRCRLIGTKRCRRNPEGRAEIAARDIDDVGDDGRGRRMRASAAAFEHQVADEIAFHHHGVEHAIGIGHRRALGHQRRVHALLDALVAGNGNAQQLDLVTHLGGIADIVKGDRLDAFDVDGLEVHFRAKGQRGQHRQLVRGIETADVEGRVSLGIAQRLRLLQHVAEGPALVGHLGEDVVAGAVENAEQLAGAVARQPLADGLDDRNAARHRGLEIQRHAVHFGQPREARTMMRQQRLVGGDDMLSGVQGGFNRRLGRVALAAHQFDEDIDIGCRGELHRIVEPFATRHIVAAILRLVAGAYSGDFNCLASSGGHQRPMFRQYVQHASADRSQPRNAQPQ